MISGKRRVDGDEILFRNGEDKKRKKVKQSTFKPQPISLNSSDTPPEDEIDGSLDLPPPPSERKIARKRDSTRIVRERATTVSPSRDQSAARTGTSSNRRQDSEPPDKMPQSSGPSMASAPRPSSPPSNFASSSKVMLDGVRGEMAPPKAFVRKTRKSMRAMGIGLELEGEASASSSIDSMVPLPESETPMIRKNKELREEQQRRSSLGMRGQRASTSLGRGEISIPHSSVDTALFYTHITPTMPEPVRAKHLIVWCAKRAADAECSSKDLKAKGTERRSAGVTRTTEGDRLVKEIMDDFLAKLGSGKVDTNVFGQAGANHTTQMRPHPRNVANREKKAKDSVIIKRCKAEKYQWGQLSRQANQKEIEVIHQTKAKQQAYRPPDMTSLPEPWMKDALSLADEIVQGGEGDLTSMGEFADVEYKIDTLMQSTHMAVQYSHQTRRFLDGIFASLTADLRSREDHGADLSSHATGVGGVEGEGEGGPDHISLLSTATRQQERDAKGKSRPRDKDPIHLLRALADADLRSGVNEEAINAMGQLDNVVAVSALASQVNASVGHPGIGVTPRRMAHGTQTPKAHRP